MKGYLVLLAAAALMLMMLPLPALGKKAVSDDAAPVTVTTAATDTVTTAATNATTTPTVATGSTETAEFRILFGDAVTVLDNREFLIRTLAFEMPVSYHTEALKAQTVAAYTYYSRRRNTQRITPDPALKGADFAAPDNTFPANYTPEALQQRWGESYTANRTRLEQAVDAVLGKTILYQGELIDACYFAISSGCTESAATLWGNEVPYLRPVASPGDKLSPGYESEVSFTADALKDALCAACSGLELAGDASGWLGQPQQSSAGTVIAVTAGNQTLTGRQIREALGLRSACFRISYADGNFTFTVWGYGHGVGMSQYGADYLARQGYGWEEILHYYYTGVSIA